MRLTNLATDYHFSALNRYFNNLKTNASTSRTSSNAV